MATEPTRRIPPGRRITLTDGAAFRVLEFRAGDGGVYLLESIAGKWRFIANAAKVEAENPNALVEVTPDAP